MRRASTSREQDRTKDGLYRKLLKESYKVKSCFCILRDTVEFGGWRSEEKIAPVDDHLTHDGYFLADCATSRSRTRLKAGQQVANAKAEREPVSRRAKKEPNNNVTVENLQFCHLESVREHIRTYKETKQKVRAQPATLMVSNRNYGISTKDIVGLPPAQIDGAPESSTEAVQLRAPFHVSPYLSPTPIMIASFQPKQHSSHANERIIVTNSRSNGKPITLVEFRKVQSKEPEGPTGPQCYSGLLLSARLHSASRPAVPTNPKKLEIGVLNVNHSHTDMMESTTTKDTPSDSESTEISESQHSLYTAPVQQHSKKLATKTTKSHTSLEYKKQPSSHQLLDSSWTKSSSDPASVEVVGKSRFSRKPLLSAPLLRKRKPLDKGSLKRSNTEHFQSTIIEMSEGQSTRQGCLSDLDFEDTREANDNIGKELPFKKDQRRVRFLDQPDLHVPEETDTTSMTLPKNIRCYLRSRDRRRCQNRSQTTGRAGERSNRHLVATKKPPFYYKRKLLPMHDDFHSQDEEQIYAE